MEYLRHSLIIRILTVLLTVILQIDLLDSITSSHSVIEQSQEQIIDQADQSSEKNGDTANVLCHLRTQQKGRIQILYPHLKTESSPVIIETYQQVSTNHIHHFISGESRSLQILFCVYRI